VTSRIRRLCDPVQPGGAVCDIVGRLWSSDHRSAVKEECAVNIVVVLIILLLVFGGGGFYAGGPMVGGSLGGIVLLILIVLLLTGRLR
jgi:hypothetical protein